MAAAKPASRSEALQIRGNRHGRRRNLVSLQARVSGISEAEATRSVWRDFGPEASSALRSEHKRAALVLYEVGLYLPRGRRADSARRKGDGHSGVEVEGEGVQDSISRLGVEDRLGPKRPTSRGGIAHVLAVLVALCFLTGCDDVPSYEEVSRANFQCREALIKCQDPFSYPASLQACRDDCVATYTTTVTTSTLRVVP